MILLILRNIKFKIYNRIYFIILSINIYKRNLNILSKHVKTKLHFVIKILCYEIILFQHKISCNLIPHMIVSNFFLNYYTCFFFNMAEKKKKTHFAQDHEYIFFVCFIKSALTTIYNKNHFFLH